MTLVAVAVLLAFGAGAVEGLARGGGAGCVPLAMIAGLVWGTLALVVVAAARGVARLWGEDGWPLAIAVAGAVFVAGEFAAARELTGRFRDPALVAGAAAASGVAIAGICGAVVVPLVVRMVRAGRRFAPGRRARGLLVGAGITVAIGGLVVLVRVTSQPRMVRPVSEVVVRAIALAEMISDVDGDGDGLVLPPRDCAPLSPRVDGKLCVSDK